MNLIQRKLSQFVIRCLEALRCYLVCLLPSVAYDCKNACKTLKRHKMQVCVSLLKYGLIAESIMFGLIFDLITHFNN